MKKVLIAIAFGLFAVSATYAQTDNQANNEQQSFKRERATPEDRASRQTKMMSKSLGLTADQETKLQALNLKRINDMQAAREKLNNNGGSQNNSFSKEAKTLRDSYETQLKTILTPEQYTKYQSQREEKRGGKDHRNMRGRNS
ncbi:MAG: DUF4890 domain-containing protein [Bacteroidota bacterium]|nr:DUF4890 domain-containing protein [Bacteroidota bacterium]